MGLWNCHPHPKLLMWINGKARNAYPGLRQSFDAACAYGADDGNWGGRSGVYAFADYVPGKHPLTYPMVIKLRVEAAYTTVVGVVLEREDLAFWVD